MVLSAVVPTSGPFLSGRITAMTVQVCVVVFCCVDAAPGPLRRGDAGKLP
jgi:hypothetical protein